MATANGSTDWKLPYGVKQFAFDVLSGWMFLALFLATNNIFLATSAGLATGIGQAIWMISRKQKIEPMQWMVMALVLGLGGATIVTHDPTFMVFKPSILEAGIAFIMLWPNWIARYLPARAREFIPSKLICFWGYLYAAAWFACAASNLVVARVYGLKAWAIYSNVSPFVVMGALAGLGFLVFPSVVRRTARARGVDLLAPPVA